MEYVAANAMPLKARDAMRGSPSPWKVFAMIPQHARNSDRRLNVSVKESSEGVDIVAGSLRCEVSKEWGVGEIGMVAKTRLKSHEFETKLMRVEF
jgi:hypothetical protein